MKQKLIFLILVLVFSSIPLFADQQSDIIIVIDQSRSIREAMPAIKDYVKDRIFHDIAKEGDRIHVLSFDGQFYEQGVLSADAEKRNIEALLASVQPVGAYTDLTNAVIEMSKYSIDKSTPGSKKIVFFMTDGLNEPPAYSPYRDGLKDDYFKKAREYFKGRGWTVFVTGIGEKTNAPELAELLAADYVQLSSKPTSEEFDLVITEKLDKARNATSLPILPIGIGTFIIVAAGGTSIILLKKKA